MADVWLISGLTDGVLLWDIHISKLLSIVLISAFASRCGDVVRTYLFKGIEALTFGDLTIKYQGGEEIQNLTMNVCLRFVKCFKDLKNEDRYLRVDILNDSSHNSVCAVKLLIIHALRVGAVSATTWEDLQAHTLDRADKTLKWTTPDKPVIAAIIPGRCSFLDLDKPAGTKQTRETMHAMSMRGRVIAKATSQDLRRGSVADLAHLSNGSIKGVATAEVASLVGHSKATFNNNITERYSGGADISTWNLRAQSTWIDSRAPRIASTAFIPAPMTEEDLSMYAEARGLDASDKLVRRNARVWFRKQHEETWRELAREERATLLSSSEKPKVRQALGPATSSKSNANILRKKLDIPIDPQLLEMSKTSAISSATSESAASTPSYLSSASTTDLSEEDSENADYLMEIVTGIAESSVMSGTEQEGDLLESLEDLHHAAERSPHPVYCDADQFITNFSKINILRNDSVADMGQKKYDDVVAKFVATGNSRDVPTRYLFYCSNEIFGCDYHTPSNGLFTGHLRKCKISENNPVKPEIYKCRKKGCEETFSIVHTRNKHERDHDFKSRECNLGCNDKVLYKTEQSWRSHKSRRHNTEWDQSMLCLFPNCPKITGFPTREGYGAHLRDTHKLSSDDVKKFVPALPNREPVWGKRPCPFPDCVRAAPGQEIIRKKEMRAHLTTKQGGHECSPEEIERLIEQILASG